MILADLIEALEAFDADTPVQFGFGQPDSYRGCFDELAFEPLRDTTAGAMLEAARSAMSTVYTGYKGGAYRMGPYTECHLAPYGETGEAIGPLLLAFMMGQPAKGWGWE